MLIADQPENWTEEAAIFLSHTCMVNMKTMKILSLLSAVLEASFISFVLSVVSNEVGTTLFEFDENGCTKVAD